MAELIDFKAYKENREKIALKTEPDTCPVCCAPVKVERTASGTPMYTYEGDSDRAYRMQGMFIKVLHFVILKGQIDELREAVGDGFEDFVKEMGK